VGRTTVLPLFPSRLAAKQVGSVSFWGESGRKSTRATCGAVGSYDKQTEKERKALDKRQARADSVCMNTTTTSQQIAQTILSQLGGSLFVAMTGARDLLQLEAGLRCRMGRGALCSHLQIDIDLATDTYTVSTYKIRGLNCRELARVEHVYADALRGTVEQLTGFFLSL